MKYVDDLKADKNLDVEIARDSSKRSDFNPSVAKSENLEHYSRHSKQLGIGRVSRKWKSKEREDTFIDNVKTVIASININT